MSHTADLQRDLRQFIPAERIFTDPLRLLAYGTDASLYRLIPKLVVKTVSEEEVRKVLQCCHARRTPLTFRAAGTSLAGQALSDSVLMVMGDHWQGITLQENGTKIRLQPGVIGAEANRRLAPFSRKIGPDPASIDAAMIGGIAANNASGMCCGTHENSYQTVDSMRIVMADGTILDTSVQASREAFQKTHGPLLSQLEQIGKRVRSNPPLAERIRQKFRIKNTTGYSLNALVDFEDPFDILQHLLIGSEGTLAFISEITYRTVVDLPEKASALATFRDIEEACQAAAAMKLKQAPVAAVELLDCPSMRAMKQPIADGAAALLIETRATDETTLNSHIAVINSLLSEFHLLSPLVFATDPEITTRIWNIRKGVFPVVAADRPPGTTVIIEDVAFPIGDLASAVLDLQQLLKEHGYREAVIYGHALDGNMHFVIFQDFSRPREIERYRQFLDAVAELVVKKYDGSLKAEHGTGRNMAPFVEMEWGKTAYELMREIKQLFDPENLLNPGVILNTDPHVHLKNLKPLPLASPLIDACMECGFCEAQCPSRGLTLTPRQRITALRELARLSATEEDAARERHFRRGYIYDGARTCAACGLCSTTCPMGVNTGKMIKHLRGKRLGNLAQWLARFTADHYAGLLKWMSLGLAALGVFRKLMGDRAFTLLNAGLRALSRGLLPKITHNIPGKVSFRPKNTPKNTTDSGIPIVYLPSCSTRSMGPAGNDPIRSSVPEVLQKLLERAGYSVIYPKNLDGLCCGQAWETLGLQDTADAKAAELEAALVEASQGGRLPIIFDTSTCSYRMKEYLQDRLAFKDVIDALHDDVLPKLQVTKKKRTVLLHLNCGAKKMGLEPKLLAVAKACATQVIVPEYVTCCGFSGSWGFHTPELNEHATRHLHKQVPNDCKEGYSTNRPCEIGLSDQAGVPYRSIVHLVAEATESGK